MVKCDPVLLESHEEAIYETIDQSGVLLQDVIPPAYLVQQESRVCQRRIEKCRSSDQHLSWNKHLLSNIVDLAQKEPKLNILELQVN